LLDLIALYLEAKSKVSIRAEIVLSSSKDSLQDRSILCCDLGPTFGRAVAHLDDLRHFPLVDVDVEVKRRIVEHIRVEGI
jgi:hypothetical protein